MSESVGFTSLLALVFIVLKLCKVITWSWVWILSPIWIPALVVVGLLIGWGIYWFRKNAKSKKRIKQILKQDSHGI